MSTRTLARLAHMSQPYVVALERARAPGVKPGPTPTIDVTARLAAALRIEPEALMRCALRRRGAHVLLVIDESVRSPLDVVAGHTTSTTQWVLAGARAGSNAMTRRHHRSINLRRDGCSGYDTEAIAAALNRELASLCAGQPEEAIGMVFADTSAVMSALDDPTPLLDFERDWADVAARAAWQAGTHATWNVCVYQVEALRQLADPVATSLDLIRHHDDIWVSTGARFAHGRAGRLRMLHHMKPAGSGVAEWRQTSRQLLDSTEVQ